MISNVPTWEQYLVPLLTLLSDGGIHRGRDLADPASDLLGVTATQRAERVSNGRPRHVDRVLWSLTALQMGGATERPTRGRYRITETGKALLASHPDGLSQRDMMTLPGYAEWRQRSRRGTADLINADGASAGDASLPAVAIPGLSPRDLIEQGRDDLHAQVATELIQRLHEQPPIFFERAVLDLLTKMGFGGVDGAAAATPLSNDGGIDGIVEQDALGIGRIFVQAKRYAPDTSVGRPDVQAFVGALHGNQAGQGVFFTTGRFSAGARAYAESIPMRVVLVDGAKLAELMIEFGVGVQVKQTVHIVEIDEDFFE